MTVRFFNHQVSTRGEADIVDVTGEILRSVSEAGVQRGTATLFVPGSTAGFTTLEFEPGVVTDLRDCFDRLIPRSLDYAHERAWHDGNGHSHVRAALLGPSLVLPIEDGRPLLGTWQQAVLVDFDNRPRERRWTVTVIGE